ncbi:hypothetical protein GA0115243_104528 [Streptomyces sp. ScaeMP-e83]|nr:hypothetical protein GA0115243_104528 [Streptomyces sp. ScaeMP-e83]
MVFPVCVGELWAPLAAVHRMVGVAGRSGGVRRAGLPVPRARGGAPGYAAGDYERPLTVSRTFALISAGIGA